MHIKALTKATEFVSSSVSFRPVVLASNCVVCVAEFFKSMVFCAPKTIFRVYLLCFSMMLFAEANPIGVCIRNCAQCKKMFGPYFEGQLCADACVKFKGKMIPDCEDIASIAPFLNKYEYNN